MSKSTDPGHFFQTEAALATAARRAAKASNKNGDPITCTSKALAVLADPLDRGRVYVAESGGPVRRVVLETGDKSHYYRGHSTPVTCLALSSDCLTLFAGSWDKTISAWNVDTRERLRVFSGHADFVKSLLYIPTPSGGLLLSGSSDTTIHIWNALTGDRIHTLRGHTRGVGTMALDPVASTPDTAVVYAAGSERDIRRWNIPLTEPARGEEAAESIVEHETSVYKLVFAGEDADLWSASADFTAKRIDVRKEVKGNGQRADTVLKHADYVNDVLVEPNGRWVATACRDEGVRLWDVATGELYHTFDGHADEVTGLAIAGERGDVLVSVSIDCTVRRWSLKLADLKAAVEAAKAASSGEPKELKEERKESMLTEEEEKELAELMEDSE